MFPPERLGQCAFVVALLIGALQCAFPASAVSGPATCASSAGPRAPVPVPKEFEADVAGAFGVPVDLVRGGAFVRCAGAKLLACVVGATHPSRDCEARHVGAWSSPKRRVGPCTMPVKAIGGSATAVR